MQSPVQVSIDGSIETTHRKNVDELEDISVLLVTPVKTS